MIALPLMNFQREMIMPKATQRNIQKNSKSKTLAASFIFLLSAHSLTHSATIQPGDLLISEVMANPSAVSDANGEWFEVFNASANSIDLNGLSISDNGSNSHLIDNGGSLFITAGSYLVLGRNGDSASNGDYIADYIYTNFSLGNTLDQIILLENSNEIVRLDYTGLPFGSAGISAELIRQTANPDESDFQLTENSTYGLGDSGTPGSAGSFELISAAPVPIPGAIWLFISAFIFLVRKPNLVRQNSQPIRKYCLC